MRIATDWLDYELIDCTEGERLERWGIYTYPPRPSGYLENA